MRGEDPDCEFCGCPSTVGDIVGPCLDCGAKTCKDCSAFYDIDGVTCQDCEAPDEQR